MILDAALRPRLLTALALLLAAPLALAAEGRDGRLFDPGVAMSHRASGAPAQLDQAAFLVGEWDVSCTRSPGEDEAIEVDAVSSITWMNRGHGLMERAFTADADGDGHPSHDIRLLVFNGAGGVWSYGEAGTWRESTRAMQGPPTPGAIVLHDASRPGGGPSLELRRRTYRETGPRAFAVADEASTDMGESWTTRVSCAYARRPQRAPELIPADDLGAPAPGRPPEASEFDFLLGEHDAAHWLLFGGREVRFPTTTTAVYALGGFGILEFNWFDLDPNLPDAGTTVVRLYNRAERRWESLFVNNRFNSVLRFGGRQEGDRIVLHTFEVDSTGVLSRFVFHDIGEDGYRWYAERSQDRGATFQKTWTIDVTARDESGS